MLTRRFSISHFIRDGEYFHFARKRLEARKPRFLHDHDYFEVFLVTHGAVDHWLPDGPVRLEQGSLVFVRPHDRHALQSSRNEAGEIINIAFRSEIAEHLGDRYAPEVQRRFFWHDRELPETYFLSGPRFERAVNLSSEIQPSRSSLAAIEEYLLSLFTRVLDHHMLVDETVPQWLVSAAAAARRPEVFRDGAAGFVNAAGRGHEHVCRMTRKHFGMSPSAYVNKVRMEHAAQLLASSDQPINDISNDCGIENLSYFYRVFQRQYGTTPRQYRMHHQKNPLRAS